MRALWLADVLRSVGLTVVEEPGWQTRGKELDAIEGVFAHHTASPVTSKLAVDLHVVTNGNGVAPGPIAQVLLERGTGVAHIIASGKANHAGAGGPWGWLPVSPPGQLSVANARTIGIECVNNGIGEAWAPDLVAALEIGSAAILRRIGQDAGRLVTHHEWAPTRKPDPAGPTGGRIAPLPNSRTWDGNALRARVQGWLAPPHPLDPIPIPSPIPTPEDAGMHVIVGRKANQADPRRWAWDGISIRKIADEAEFAALYTSTFAVFKLHPNFSTLAAPYWMTDEDISRYAAPDRGLAS